jgi:hypothetical protein
VTAAVSETVCIAVAGLGDAASVVVVEVGELPVRVTVVERLDARSASPG